MDSLFSMSSFSRLYVMYETMSFVYSSVSPICVGGSSFLYYAYASYIVLGMDFKDNAWTWNIQKKFNVVRQEVDEFVGVVKSLPVPFLAFFSVIFRMMLFFKHRASLISHYCFFL